MIEKLAAGAVSVGAAGAIGTAAASGSPYSEIANWMPIITGVICAIIVWTITVMNSTKKRVWTYNLLVGLLTSIFTAVIVTHFDLKPMFSMFIGMGAGSMGVGVISFGKPMLVKVLGFAVKELDSEKPTP